MNSGHTTERVYDALKRMIFGREFRPGTRLDPALLSEQMSSSVTPVRDALNLLTGQGLVEARTGEGFHLPHVTEPDLRDLYEWNTQVLALAMRQQRHPMHPHAAPDNQSNDFGESAMLAFNAIAAASGNAEHLRVIESLNGRLMVARRVEGYVLDDVSAETATLSRAIGSVGIEELRRLVGNYHRRRQRVVAEIVRAIYRDS